MEGDTLDSGAARDGRLRLRVPPRGQRRWFGTDHPRRDLEQNTIAVQRAGSDAVNGARRITFSSTGSIYEARHLPTPEVAPFPSDIALRRQQLSRGLLGASPPDSASRRIFRFVSILGKERYTWPCLRLLREAAGVRVHEVRDGRRRKLSGRQDCVDAMLTVIEGTNRSHLQPRHRQYVVVETRSATLSGLGVNPERHYTGERGWIGDSLHPARHEGQVPRVGARAAYSGRRAEDARLPSGESLGVRSPTVDQ